MTAPVIQFKRGLLANLPGLRVGEPGFTTDSYDLYVGLTSETSTNKFLGSHRYWTKNTATTGSGVNLVEGTDNGSDFITLKSPDSLAGIITYTFPATPSAGDVLSTDADGNLSWVTALSDLAVTNLIIGIGTFTNNVGFTTDTDNTLGDPDTGGVQIDGGLGVNKNVTVGAGLSVVGGFEVAGIATVTGSLDVNGTDHDINGAIALDHVTVSAGATVGGALDVNGDGHDIAGTINLDNVAVSGITTFTGAIDGNSGADISGGETTLSSATVSDLTSGRVVLAGTSGALEDSLNLTFNGSILTVGGTLSATGTDHDINGAIALDNVTVSAGTTIGGTLDVNGTDHDISGAIALDHVTISGITTITGSIDANGATHDIAGVVELDNINVATAATVATAIITNATITNTTFGSGTAITSVDTDLSSVSASDDTLASAKAIKAYVDSQVTAQDLDFAGDSGTGAVDLDSQTFTIAGTEAEIVTSASGQTITIGLPDNVTVGAALTVTSKLDVNGDGHDIAGTIALDNVAVSGITTFSGAIDANGGAAIDNIQIGVTNDNEIDTSSGNLTIDSAGGTVTIDDELIVSGDVRINGNDIKASDGTTAVTMSSANVTVAGDLTVGGNDIKASDGTTALTLSAATGAVSTANDLTVTGNLYVSGNTTQVNTAALTVEDRTIDLGIVNGSTPAADTTWDLGVLFNYYTSGSAKKSAVVWEHADTRFKFASVLAADTNGSDNDTPQLTVTTFAPIEIGALWVNDCAGQSQVISCTGSERFLENITVDAGTF